MLHDLDVPFLDAAADQLVWRLGAPPQPALATMVVELGTGRFLEVRLLGASHQVLVRDGASGAVRCSELVACVPDLGGDLPPTAVRRVDDLEYRFASEVRRVDVETLGQVAADLRGRATEVSLLVGSFPGSPHAVTAVEVVDDGWRTWHLYPQTGEVVTTTTSLAVRP